MIKNLNTKIESSYKKWKKNRRLKVIFLSGGLFFLLFQMSGVIAAGGNTEAQIMTEQLVSWNNFLQVLSSIAYVILRPLIALAGLLMDNQLIYGSFMHLDTALWKIWQIVRTFANYALGLIFLIWILIYNLSPERKIWSVLKGIDKPQDLIKKTLIASILIQASWFILMAAVDLSTILTYTVGAIPTTLVGNTDMTGMDSRILGMNTFLNLWDEGIQKDKTTDEAIVTYWNTKQWNSEKYIAPCRTIEVWSGKEGQSFIIGRKFSTLIWWSDKTPLQMEKWYCVYYGSLISFSELNLSQGESFSQKMQTFESDVKKSSEAERNALVKAGMIYPITPWRIIAWSDTVWLSVLIGKNTYTSKGINPECKIFWVVSPKKDKEGKFQCLYNNTELSISNIISKAKAMTGPFTSLYTSMLNFSSLGTSNLGIWQNFIVALINAGFAILLLLPLVALVAVLFARIGILRLAIALSPFIVLIRIFDKLFPKDILPKYIALDELIKLLVAPVLISFAVSLSLVFMTALKSSLWNTNVGLDEENGNTNSKKIVREISGMDIDDNGNLSFLGFIKIKFDNALINFSWFLTMIFGIWITRFLLFWAIKQTKIGESIGSSLQKFWENTLWTLPIIPIGEKWVGFNAVKTLANDPDKLTWDLIKQMEIDQTNRVSALFDKDKREELQAKNLTSTFFNTPESSPVEHFNIDTNDLAGELSTFERVDTDRKAHFSNTSWSLQKMQDWANRIRKDQLNKAENAQWDPENPETEAGKAKEALNNILSNSSIQGVKTIKSWESGDIKIGTSTYKIENNQLTIKS